MILRSRGTLCSPTSRAQSPLSHLVCPANWKGALVVSLLLTPDAYFNIPTATLFVLMCVTDLSTPVL